MAKVALLIGVSEYEPGLNSLPGAAKDIEALKLVLQNPRIGNFTEVKTLINPDRQQMGEAIEGMFSDRNRDDLVLLYFSGHGITDENGKLYFATRITRKNFSGALVKATAVAASSVHDIMDSSRSKRQVVILDCCFSGAFADGISVKDDGFVDIKNQLGGEGRAILTSSTSTQYSFEEASGDLSTYTRYVVEGLKTGAADRGSDSWISVDELHEYVRRKVQEAAPAMNPQIYASKEGYKIQLAQASVDDPKFKYRQEVEYWATEGHISEIGQTALDELRKSLGITEGDASAIEEDVEKPYKDYQRKLQSYTQVFTAAIQRTFPISERTRADLNRLQQSLGLDVRDVALIEVPLLEEYQSSPEEKVDNPVPTKPRKALQLSGLFVGALLCFLGGLTVAQQHNPAEVAFCPTENFGYNSALPSDKSLKISIGKEILLKTDTNRDKEDARAKFAAQDFDQAIKKFLAYREQNRSDPEALIYLNNAKIGNQKAFKIAVSVPIGTNPEVAKEILRGVSQAQDEVNSSSDKINGNLLKVAIANDNNNENDVKEIATKLANDLSISAVIGHNKSEVSLEAAKVYKPKKLVMVSPTSDATSLAVEGSPIFHLMPDSKYVAQELSKYALSHKLNNILVCLDSKARATGTFQSRFDELFKGEGKFSPVICDFSDNNFSSKTILKNAKDANGILLLPGVTSIEKAIDLARENRGQKALLSFHTLNSNQILRQSGCVLKNTVIVAPWNPTKEPGRAFFQQSKKFWRIAANWRTAMAYDATKAVIKGLGKIQQESTISLREQLANQLKDENFSLNGVTGTIGFQVDRGDRISPMTLLKVQPSDADPYEFVPF